MFTKTSGFNNAAKSALNNRWNGRGSVSRTQAESGLSRFAQSKSGMGNKSGNISAGQNSALSMMNKTEHYQKQGSQRNDRLIDELGPAKPLANSASQQGMYIDQINNPRNMQRTSPKAKLDVNDRAFNIFNSNVAAGGSPRVKTGISHKDFFALFHGRDKSGEEEPDVERMLQGSDSYAYGRAADPNALAAIRAAMPTVQRRMNQQEVGAIQQKRALEHILNSSYQLGVSRIDMPGRLKHLDEKAASTQSKSTQANSQSGVPSSSVLSQARSAAFSAQSNAGPGLHPADSSSATQLYPGHPKSGEAARPGSTKETARDPRSPSSDT